MNIVDFVKNLISRISKDDVLDDIDNTIKVLETCLLPISANFKQNTGSFKSSKVKTLLEPFVSNYKGKNKSDIIDVIATTTPMLLTNAKILKQMLEAEIEPDVIKDGLTAKKLILIRACEHLEFLSSMGLDVLNICCNIEVEDTNKDVDYEKPHTVLSNQTLSNLANYGFLLSSYAVEADKFKAMVDKAPETIFNSMNSNLIGSFYGSSEIDPLNIHVMHNFRGNPIYHFRMVIAEWQTRRYKAKKEKKEMLELKILHLKSLNDKNPDPKIEQMINHTQSRVNKLEREMEDLKG